MVIEAKETKEVPKELDDSELIQLSHNQKLPVRIKRSWLAGDSE